MKIKYRLTNGEASDISLIEDDYELQTGELSTPGGEITKGLTDSLHDSSYIISRVVEKQETECIRLLQETDHKMLSDFAYANNQGSWKAYRQELRDIITGGVKTSIPDKPF